MTKKLLTFLAVVAAVGFSSVQASDTDSTPKDPALQPTTQVTPPTTDLDPDQVPAFKSVQSTAPVDVCVKPEGWDGWALAVTAAVGATDIESVLVLFREMAAKLTPATSNTDALLKTPMNPHATLIAQLNGATEETAMVVAGTVLDMFKETDADPEVTPAPGSGSATPNPVPATDDQQEPADASAPAPTGGTGTPATDSQSEDQPQDDPERTNTGDTTVPDEGQD